MGLFSLNCQLACGILCLWYSSERQVFHTGFDSQPEHFTGWGWESGEVGRDEFLIAAETQEEAERAALVQPVRAGNCSSFPPFFNTSACP